RPGGRVHRPPRGQLYRGRRPAVVRDRGTAGRGPCMTAATQTRRFAGVAAWTAASVIILIALSTAAFRLVVPLVPAYRADVERWASGVFGAPVDIDALDLRWRGLRPEIVLDGVRFISADAQRAVAAREVRIGIGFRALLMKGRVV